MRTRLAIVSLVAATTLTCQAPKPPTWNLLHTLPNIEFIDEIAVVPHRAIVKFRGELPTRNWDPALFFRIAGLREIARFSEARVMTLEAPSRSAKDLIDALRRTGQFKYVQPDHVMLALKTPRDSYWTKGKLWGLEKIDCPLAWDCSTGDREVVVAVVDGGIDTKHADFDQNLWEAPPNFTVDVDGQPVRCKPRKPGYDAIKNDCESRRSQHGSHVAGTIGAAEGKDGVVGVNWQTKLLSLRFLDGPSGKESDALKALEFLLHTKQKYPTTADVWVANLSWGTYGYSQALYDALELIVKEKILLVAAAGNDGTNNDVTKFYPASLPLTDLIAVAASNSNDELTADSNYGNSIYIAAPGEDIWSADLSPYHETLSGTSMAAAHVSGAAALVAAACETLSPEDIKKLLIKTADPVTVTNKTFSGGRVNVREAVKACDCRN